MNILGIAHRDSGCGYHRIQLPLLHMEQGNRLLCDVPTVDILQQKWDILNYNRISTFDEIWDKFRDTINTKIVLDLDDYWHLPPSHPLYSTYVTLSKRIIINIEQADLVTVTTDLLASKVKPYNNNVIVLPNAIPYGIDQFTDKQTASNNVRIFWAGGSTHQDDLELLRNPIRRLSHHKNIEMVLGGFVESTIWRRMLSAFTSGGQLPHTKITGLPVNEYMSMYENADIMLVPLEATEWHACKSNLKLLEAATKKIPVICSKVQPYNLDEDAPVLWVEKQSDWYKHINFLINDKEARKDFGQKLSNWANTKYNFAAINKKRQLAFEQLVKA